MNVTYKVIVIKIDSERSMSDPEVLFEAGSPNAARLLAYAPSEVQAALSEQVYENGADEPIAVAAPAPAMSDILDEEPTPATEGDSSASTPLNPFPDVPNKPRRKRRTKEEIAADKAREEAIAAGGEPLPATEPPVEVAAPAAAPEPVPAEPAAPVAATVPAPETPSVPPAAPYNPFL